MKPALELVIRHVGFGLRCANCGRIRETTRYVLRQGEDEIRNILLCDSCQDKGFVVRFTPKPTTLDTRHERKRRIKISRALEQVVAHDIGGKTQPGSGNQDAKDDIRKVDEWRIEHKYTDSISGYRLSVESLAAIVRHANLAGEWPALVLAFRKLGRKFAVIPYELFIEIVEQLHG